MAMFLNFGVLESVILLLPDKPRHGRAPVEDLIIVCNLEITEILLFVHDPRNI